MIRYSARLVPGTLYRRPLAIAGSGIPGPCERNVIMTDIRTPTAIDMDQALLDPGAAFESPEDVLARPDLSREQKIELLRRWEYDANQACVALEEGMPGGEADLLQRILLALGQLDSGIDRERVDPTKQHGIGPSTRKRT